ncbi:MAG TPA: hypothetical protein PLI89_12235, partial [Chitinophagales bacterium]|nr:hypothetical protein [Chitinophagales bacterium]
KIRCVSWHTVTFSIPHSLPNGRQAPFRYLILILTNEESGPERAVRTRFRRCFVREQTTCI